MTVTAEHLRLTRGGTVITDLHWRVTFALVRQERQRQDLLAAYQRGEVTSPFLPEAPLPCPAGQTELMLG